MGEPDSTGDTDSVIGRYVAEFADVCWTLRHGTTRVGHIAGQSARTIRALSDELPATRLAETFFAMCEAVKDYTAEEAEVAAALHRQVREAIGRRDAYMNGDWWAGWVGGRGNAMHPWVRDRGKQVDPAELVRHTDDLARLRGLLEQFVELVSGYAQEAPARQHLLVHAGRSPVVAAQRSGPVP